MQHEEKRRQLYNFPSHGKGKVQAPSWKAAIVQFEANNHEGRRTREHETATQPAERPAAGPAAHPIAEAHRQRPENYDRNEEKVYKRRKKR